MEVNNGGFSQYLVNPTGALFEQTLAASRLIQSRELESQLLRIAVAIPDVFGFHSKVNYQDVHSIVVLNEMFLRRENNLYDESVRDDAIGKLAQYCRVSGLKSE